MCVKLLCDTSVLYLGTAQVPRYSAIPLEGGVDLLVPDFGLARSGCCGRLGIEPVFRKLLSISSPLSLSSSFSHPSQHSAFQINILNK